KLRVNAKYISAVCLLAVASSLAAAQTSVTKHNPGAPSKQAHDALIHTLFAGRSFSQVVISPDGKRVAWVETSPSGKSGLYVSSTAPGSPAHRITAGSAA